MIAGLDTLTAFEKQADKPNAKAIVLKNVTIHANPIAESTS